MNLQEDIQRKWEPILAHPDLAPIKDTHRRSVTAVVLENTKKLFVKLTTMSHRH